MITGLVFPFVGARGRPTTDFVAAFTVYFGCLRHGGGVRRTRGHFQ